MSRRPLTDPDTAETLRQQPGDSSGVHAAAPGPENESREPGGRLLGSIPRADVSAAFQPIVDLSSGKTVGYEVLPRCRCEGLTDPEELFARAIVEKNVGELGRSVRAIAMRECVGSALYISIHPAELKDPFLVRPDDPICHHDAPVHLQLSQAAFSGLAAHVIRELGSRGGLGLVLDNLGAGPTTLKQLVDLRPVAVKLDRELCAGLDKSARKQAVVRGLVSMCEQLGARVIAKGVDCEEELQAAQQCGITTAQGYILGEPSALPMISIWPPAPR